MTLNATRDGGYLPAANYATTAASVAAAAAVSVTPGISIYFAESQKSRSARARARARGSPLSDRREIPRERRYRVARKIH